MITQSIDIMMSRPGIYVVLGGGMFMVEVADGLCYQLRLLDGERDGEMTPGGWNVEMIAGILGPFVRAPAPAPAANSFLPGQGFPGDASGKM